MAGLVLSWSPYLNTNMVIAKLSLSINNNSDFVRGCPVHPPVRKTIMSLNMGFSFSVHFITAEDLIPGQNSTQLTLSSLLATHSLILHYGVPSSAKPRG